MRTYLDLLQDIRKYGEERGDRTGTGTTSYFGPQWEHDFKYGFPLLTTKKLAFRWIAEELFWFLSGSTDEAELRAKGVDLWKEWADAETCSKFGRKEGDLGPVYGKQFRMFGEYSRALCPVPQREPSEASMGYEPPHPVQAETTWTLTDAEPSTDEHRHRYVTIAFGSGVTQRVRMDQVNNGNVSDPYAITVCGVGYRGHAPKLPAGDPMYKVWNKMLARCYAPTCKEYKYYGHDGVTVCPRWHNLGCFLDDVQNLVGYRQKLANPSGFQIDKDHYRSKVYSPETCIWLPKGMNSAYRFRTPFVATSPDGDEVYAISTEDFAYEHGLSGHSIARCLRGDRPHHKGWRFMGVPDRGLGFTTPVDQVAELVTAIVAAPMSRRLIVSGWHAAEANHVSLPPCHSMFQLYCHTDGGLSLKMYQRSADAFLGVPYNIASYALLLKMLALVTGRTAERLIIAFGDLHIYNNHNEQVDLQLSRTPYRLPTVDLTMPPGDTPLQRLLNFRWEHVKLNDYRHHEKIEAPVAV